MLRLSVLFFIAMVFLPTKVFAQCPKQGIPILKNEAAVDSFLTIYPNCDKYKVATFYSINGQQIFWIKEDIQGFLLTMVVILFVLHAGLYFLFLKFPWFQR